MNSSLLLSIDIIGAVVAITLVLLLGLWRALTAADWPAREVRGAVLTTGSVLFGWLVVALFLARPGVFASAANQPFPLIALAIGVQIVLGALLICGSRRVREIIDAVPQNWLVGLQFYRVVGLTFLVLYAAGLLPGVFALPAGIGDVLIGLSALLVAVVYARNHPQRDAYVTLWNWLGITDLVVAVATGFLSSPSQFQIFAREAPNLLIGSFPLVYDSNLRRSALDRSPHGFADPVAAEVQSGTRGIGSFGFCGFESC